MSQGKYKQHGPRGIHHCHYLTTSHTWAVKTLIAVIAVKARRLMSLRGGGSGRSGLPAAKMHYVIITGLSPFMAMLQLRRWIGNITPRKGDGQLPISCYHWGIVHTMMTLILCRAWGYPSDSRVTKMLNRFFSPSHYRVTRRHQAQME